MGKSKVRKTSEEINKRIGKGEAVVVTAEEIIDMVVEKGAREAAREVDVVTTGTFAPMCSSGAILKEWIQEGLFTLGIPQKSLPI